MAKKSDKPEVTMSKDETKAQRFVRVVTPRVSKAIRFIDRIGNCAGAAYDYTPEQSKEIIGALYKSLANLEGKFTAKKASQEEFSFTKE